MSRINQNLKISNTPYFTSGVINNIGVGNVLKNVGVITGSQASFDTVRATNAIINNLAFTNETGSIDIFIGNFTNLSITNLTFTNATGTNLTMSNLLNPN